MLRTGRYVATWLAVASLAMMLSPGVGAAERRAKSRRPDTPQAEAVELFAAMEDGQIDVQFIPRDSREARVIIKNNTKKPLNVRLPDAFAAAPVLAQAPPGLGGAQRGGAGVGGGAQPMGGGMGGMGGGMGGMGGGMGMGMMNVPPEKTAKFKVPCVCLVHGKPEPRPAIPYELKPFESYSDDAKLSELMKLFGKGGISQRAAQAATWHVANDMTWEQLATKAIEHIGAPNEPYFSQVELAAAMELVAAASRAAIEQEKPAPTDSAPAESVTPPSAERP